MRFQIDRVSHTTEPRTNMELTLAFQIMIERIPNCRAISRCNILAHLLFGPGRQKMKGETECNVGGLFAVSGDVSRFNFGGGCLRIPQCYNELAARNALCSNAVLGPA